MISDLFLYLEIVCIAFFFKLVFVAFLKTTIKRKEKKPTLVYLRLQYAHKNFNFACKKC